VRGWVDELAAFGSEDRDRAAERWLLARHTSRWYIGDATEEDWRAAYAAVDAQEDP
jgi:hypothetical protein